VPERFKHTPRTLSQKSFEAEAAKTPGKIAAVSQRLLRLASTEKQRTVSIWPNSGNYSVGGVRCLVPETMEQLLDIAAQKVNLAAAARLVFRLPGTLVYLLYLYKSTNTDADCCGSRASCHTHRTDRGRRLPRIFLQRALPASEQAREEGTLSQ
jgi:hypothetical protein